MINPSVLYPDNTNAPTPDMPYGSARNDLSATDVSGTPLDANWVNDWLGFQAAASQETGITPSGSPDTAHACQLLDMLKEIIGTAIDSAREKDHPVGSYWLTDSTVTPAAHFGFGTWERVAGRTLVGKAEAGTFSTVGATGGSESHAHGNKTGGTALTVAQIPGHEHQAGFAAGESDSIRAGMDLQARAAPTPAAWTVTTSSTGGGQAHDHAIASSSNLMPYYVTNIWRRTA